MTPTPELPPPAPAPAPTTTPVVGPPRPETVVGRLLRDGAAATVERTDVGPSQIAALRTEIRRSSTEDRRLILSAIDAKLRQELHAEVRTGLTSLRQSVSPLEGAVLTATEMRREIPALFSRDASSGDRWRGLAWLAAAGAGVASLGALFKGKLKQFLALLSIPVVAVMARMNGLDPLETVRRGPRPAVTNPDGSVSFDERLAPDVNLLDRLIAYRREGPGGGDRRLRMTAPRNGLRFEQGGRTFAMLSSANAAGTELEPFLGANFISRDADGGAAIRVARLGGLVNVTMHIAPASFSGLGAALETPGDAIRSTPLTMMVRQSDITGAATLAQVKRGLEEKGATVAYTDGTNTAITWTSTAYLRPLATAELTDVTTVRRYPTPPAPVPPPAPAP